MHPLGKTDPGRFIADFYTSFTAELLQSDEDAGVIVDRYHTPDIVEVADGHQMDRDKLIAHCRPVRKNRPTLQVEVHDAIVDGDRLAARYTMYASQRGKHLATEVYFFGRFAPDGRMRRAYMTTRTVPVEEGSGPKEVTP